MAEDELITHEEYVQAVGGFNCGQGLMAISQLSRAMEVSDSSLERSIFQKWIPQTVNQWQLAFFAKTLIENSNDYRRKEVSDKILLFACDRYNNILDPLVGNPKVKPTDEGISNFLIRTSFEQFPFQLLNYRNEVARALVLFEQIADSAKGEGFNVSESFRKISGLTIREFLLIGFVYWSKAGQPIVYPLKTDASSLKDLLAPEKQERFLSLISTDYLGFRDCQAKQERKTGFERFQFNCLNSYPLIKSDGFKKIICPIPNLLLRRFTGGLYYYLLDAYSGQGKQNSFSTFFGKSIFERYVGDQLKSYFSTDKVSGELKIGKSDKSCDWIVLEDKFVILIECKTTGLTLRAKTLGDADQIAEDLKRRIVSGVRACERTRKAIETGQPGFMPFKGKKTINLIIIYNEVFFFNAPHYRKIAAEELKKAGLEDVSYQVASIAELEYALPTLSKTGLGNLLAEKMADPDRRTWDLLSFTKRLISEKKTEEPEMNRILSAKFKEVFEPLLAPGRPGFTDGEP